MFLETPRLPDCIEFQATGGPLFQSTLITVNSGARFSNQDWEQPLGRYQISYPPKKIWHFRRLQKFFYNVHGRADGFRAKEWTDYQCIVADSALVATAVANQYQLNKKYALGASTFYRKIRKPRLGAADYVGVSLFKNGVQLTYGGGPSQVAFDESTGLVLFNTTPLITDVLTWSGEFDIPVSFDTDHMDGEIVNRNGVELLVGWQSIPLMGLRV